MKKTYSFNRQYLFIVPLLLLIPVGAIIYKIGSDYKIWGNLLFMMVAILVGLIIIFYSTISNLAGRLELEDGILSQKYLLMKVWSVAVPDLTAIFVGNTTRGPMMREIGLAFKSKDGKYFEAPYIIVGQENLIKDLLAINPNIEYHNNPAETQNWYAWKGDKNRKILWVILILVTIGLILSKIIFH